MEDARPATASDVARLVELARDARAELRTQRGGALWDTRDARPEPLEEAFASLLADPDAAVFVGTIDDQAIGYAVVHIEALRDGTALGHCTELYVEPEAREVGVGEALAGAVVALCSARDCVGIDAVALPGNRATKNFFEGQGFTARAIVMHRPLRSE